MIRDYGTVVGETTLRADVDQPILRALVAVSDIEP